MIVINTEKSSNMITYNSKRTRKHTVSVVVCYDDLHVGEYMFLNERRAVR